MPTGRVLAKVRLPLTMHERLDLMALLERKQGAPVIWTIKPLRGDPKWFVVLRRDRKAS